MKQIEFEEVTPELLGQIERVVDMATRHEYGAKSVYGAHNAVFNKYEKPAACGSCLTRKVRDLRVFLGNYREWEKENGVENQGFDLDKLSGDALKQFIEDNAIEVVISEGDTDEQVREMIERYYETNEPQSTQKVNVLSHVNTDENGAPILEHKTDEQIAVEKAVPAKQAEQIEAATIVELEDGALVSIDKTSGIATGEDTKRVKAGSYPIKGGGVLAVTVKGTATIKPADESDEDSIL